MTLPTFITARDEILGLFKAAWDANTPVLNGSVVVPVQWPGGAVYEPPDATKPFARIKIQEGPSPQRTFGRPGQRRFTRPGLVTVQVFAPVSVGGGLSLGSNLATIARNAYEGIGTASGLFFRNCRIQEIGNSGAWEQINVTAEFEYDEVR